MEPPRKKARLHKQFVFVQSFDSEADVWSELEKDGCWSKYYPSKSDDGVRQMLRCNKVRFRAATQCAASMYYIFDSKSTAINLFRAVNDHDHGENVNVIYEIPEETKIAIRNCFKYGIKTPKRVMNHLTIEKIELPEKAALIAFLKQLRTEKYGESKIDMVELKNWLKENTAIPNDKTKPFVAHFEISLDEKDPFFRFFVTTKQLLIIAAQDKKIHADGTYKLVWQGYPIIQVGTTDKHRSFHPFGIAVCTNERSADYEFIFATVKSAVKKVFNIEHSPDVLIADAGISIHNGFKKVHGDDLLIVMCWAHMRRAIIDNTPKYFKDEKTVQELLHDIDMLQLSKSHAIFDKAANDFLEKWRKRSLAFSEYFDSQWLQKHRFWYVGAREMTPNHNNALETANRLIKDEHTIRERFDLGQFRSVLYTMVETWSLDYINGTKEFHTSPKIELEQWTNAYVWAKRDFPLTVSENQSHVTYKIPVRSNHIEQPEEWNTFDEFKKRNFQFNYVKFPKPFSKNNWNEGVCDCADFFKLYICAHVLGISLRMKFIVAPPEAKALPLGQKRKPGRPAKAKAALIVQ